MYDQLVNLISTLGFPIAVSIYSLVSLSTKLDELIKSVQEVKEDISAVIKYQKEK
ncbi:YvrJ family protein [Clostridium tyrobutyricum]|uniref:YvrJ family protein n=1 Tax=Clostridium tyrobutyricum TaxID=1519 RepID=UPI001C38C6AA|nr:YvrJ family protein [Clostridium tyrobutyricum]MBV4414676.1 YvrJ family protein [Clostridium tyrobutyricum]MBV4429515.1 YvrJ family protein [Clostridium tyrobutyricum]MBV4444736.1 YvrJ family protein [Clostridium tyrobutyricum]MBV4447976.1 YvrJ family protein [Clostridium tyrobutyricum]MBV4449251.1 YvrJ family protein [Clostridium tyrobutyricum]